MRIAIGLVVKGGKEWIKDWIKCAEQIGDWIFVVDNGADKEVRDILINHKAVKRYHIQKDLKRNQSRDYQIILEDAREENCQWVWNLDIDEYVPGIDIKKFVFSILNTTSNSIGFPMFEIRGDKEHFVMIRDPTGKLKDGRLVHKMYKVLSHFEFDRRDAHGQSIPHNCPRTKTYLPIPIHHYGHMTKELRDEKRERIEFMKDSDEFMQSWMEEDETKIEIKSWKDFKLRNKEGI